MNPIFYPINTPLVNYFFYKAPLTQGGPNIPLAGGYIYFYDDNDHSVLLNTYSDVSDPANPVVNPNPLPLGAVGDCPLFYLEDRLYYIVITDNTQNQQNPITTISHYNPSEKSNSPDAGSNLNNIISNGQFNYPIAFYTINQEPGTISSPVTTVAWGWQFFQDVDTTTKNLVTFDNISNESLEGSPVFQIHLTSTEIQTSESQKDFLTFLGDVNYREGLYITISMQLVSYLGNTNLVLYLEKNYGQSGASLPELLPIGTLVATADRTKVWLKYQLPLNIGKTITEGNFSAIRIQPALGQICDVAFTNVKVEPGIVSNPIYSDMPLNFEVAQILGDSTVISDAGLASNYGRYTYVNGDIQTFTDTGSMKIYTIGAQPADVVLCNGSSYPVEGYTNNIPNSRLFNVIGTTYGGTGGLNVYATGTSVFFNSVTGGRALTNYSNAGFTEFSITNPSLGLNHGVSCSVVGANVLQVTWVGDFAPTQALPAAPVAPSPNKQSPTGNLMGNWFPYGLMTTTPPALSVTVINAGSGIAQAVAQITFSNTDITSYYTQSRIINTAHPSNTATTNFLEYAVLGDNTRGTYPSLNRVWIFVVDGYYNQSSVNSIAGTNVAYLQLSSSAALTDNLKAIAQQINNPFLWQVQILSVPAASDYFLFSSVATNYTAYYVVNGVGTAPAVPGRTEIPVAINSTDTLQVVASKTAVALNNYSFSVPTTGTHLPAVPGGLADWYITL